MVRSPSGFTSAISGEPATIVANGRSTLKVRDLLTITVTLRTSVTSLMNTPSDFRSAAAAPSMAWLHVSTDATIAPRATSFRQDFRESQTSLIPHAPFAAVAAFDRPALLQVRRSQKLY